MSHTSGMRFIWAASILAGGLLGGCLADGQVGYSAGYNVGYVAPAPVVVAAPPMVEIEPGIQVISDYDQPVFYSDNLYWRYDGGTWYSSRWHDRGWATSYNVPERVRRVDRPQSYVHYRGGARTEYRGEPRREEPYRNTGPVVRDHRDEGYREPPRNEPVVRDHREPEPYRGGGQPVVRDHRDAPPPPPQGGPVVRDHRDAPPPPPPAKKPVVRDHR